MKVHADITGLSFAAMKAMMLHEAEEHALPVTEDTDTALMVRTEYGAFGLQNLSGDKLRLRIEADRAEDLYILRDSLVGHIAHYLPEVAAQISWSDAVDTGQHPPNFQFVEVLSSFRLCADFHRLKLRLSKPNMFDDRAIHFRFLIPASETIAPEWPVLSENGGTVWPKGNKELHRPVYTATHQNDDEIDVDIFVHDGGRAVTWAQSLVAGQRVAIIGPGGGGVPVDIGKIVLAGDETAFPAMARILRTLPSGAEHQVFLLSRSGAQDYPIPTNENLNWVAEADFESAVLNALAPNCFVWVAAEKKQVAALKSDPRMEAVPKLQRYLASYWSK